jgi:antitoxin component YwqK of YwqJK toxin-antitoxin module
LRNLLVLCSICFSSLNIASAQIITKQKPKIIVNKRLFDIIDDSLEAPEVTTNFSSKSRIQLHFAPDSTLETLRNQINDSLTSVVFYTRGLLSSYSIYILKDGKWLRHGKRALFYKNGIVAEEMTYLYGEITGKYILYDESGKVKETALYKKGKKVGK